MITMDSSLSPASPAPPHDGGPASFSLLSWIFKVRLLCLLLLACHTIVMVASLSMAAVLASEGAGACMGGSGVIIAALAVNAAASAIRILWTVRSGFAQAALASSMIPPAPGSTQATSARRERRLQYRRWLWWGRFGLVVGLFQLAGAAALTYVCFKFVRATSFTIKCDPGEVGGWHRPFFFVVAIISWLLLFIQFCLGMDVLAWSSLYERHSEAWRAYYHEMFDYGIREILCCLGRRRYMKTMDNDEVDSVASLLGDLLSYRASGASHLEFLAGVALLQLKGPNPSSSEEFPLAPRTLIEEATILHPYAVAAYTGPLLDIGRYPFIFPCVWLHRQGLLMPWDWNRRPALEGDNWWRGHAKAFLRHLGLPPETLRKGRVKQDKGGAAYFVIVLHHLRSVIVAIRGTETPEDLIIDGLGRECLLSESELNAFLQYLPEVSRQEIASTGPHYGHEGIIEAARELAFQLDKVPDIETRLPSNIIDDASSMSDHEAECGERHRGFLYSLLGPNGECENYALRFVGHSLGGSIAAVTALKLFRRYPNLHVYAYGALPCIDAQIAEACSGFVTSVVYNDEFSSRLSVSSILRLREDAMKALAAEGSLDGPVALSLLAHRLLGTAATQRDEEAEFTRGGGSVPQSSERGRRGKGRYLEYRIKGGLFLCSHACQCVALMSQNSSVKPLRNVGVAGSCCETLPPCIRKGRELVGIDTTVPSCDVDESFDEGFRGPNHVCVDSSHSQGLFLDAGKCRTPHHHGLCLHEECEHLMLDPQNDNGEDHLYTGNGNGDSSIGDGHHLGINPSLGNSQFKELFLPGFVIHLVPHGKGGARRTLWSGWAKQRGPKTTHKAVVRERGSFNNIVISPSMFLDHMPWRCQYALNSALEQMITEAGSSSEEHIV